MKGGKLVKFLVGLFLAFFVIYQIFAALYHPFTTISAQYYETNDGITADAYIVRNEAVIDGEKYGNITNNALKSYAVENGERIAKNGVIADVYSSEDSSDVYAKIADLQNRMRSLQNISNYCDANTDVAIITEKISSKLIEYNDAFKNGKYVNSDEHQSDLFAVLSSKQNIIGGTGSIDEMLASVKTEMETLKASASKPLASITAPLSGYFVSDVDGYENVLTIENVTKLKPEDIENIKPQTPKSTALCKIVSDYTWYFAVLVDGDDALKLKEGNNYTVLTDEDSSNKLTCNLEALNSSEKSDKTVAIFSCNITDGAFATLRTVSITVVLDSCKGIKLPNRSIRIVYDNIGVYVVSAGIIKFKKVEIVKTFDNYTVCKLDETGSANSLRLYDEVVDKGKNLYDGKTVN